MTDLHIDTAVPGYVADALRRATGETDLNTAARAYLERAARPTDEQLARALKKPRGKLLSSPRNDPTKLLRDIFSEIDLKRARAPHGRPKK